MNLFIDFVALFNHLIYRQSHKSFFEKSDLFFVCLLQPLSFDIQIQESEIEAAQVNMDQILANEVTFWFYEYNRSFIYEQWKIGKS